MKKQQGFAHAVLIIGMVVAIVGALGFIFWQNFIYKEPVVTVDTDSATTKQERTTDKTDSSAVKTGKLNVKEWSVSAAYTSDVVYEYKIEKDYLYLIHPDLPKSCERYTGSIGRFSGAETMPQSKQRVDDFYESRVNNKELSATQHKVGDAYYFYFGVQSTCPDINKNQTLKNKQWTKTVEDTQAILHKLTAL